MKKILFCFLWVILSCTESSKSVKEVVVLDKEVDTSNIEFEGYIKTKNMVKAVLNDPESFEELNKEIVYGIKNSKGGTFMVKIDYTAKNGFGGRIKNNILVLYDDSLNIKDLVWEK